MTLHERTAIAAALLTACLLTACDTTTPPESTDAPIPTVETTTLSESIYQYPIDSVFFPTGKESFADAAIGSVQNLYVAEDNPSYTSTDGVIFSKDGKTLVAFPAGRIGEYKIPDGTQMIGTAAFQNCRIEMVYIPDSVTRLADGAFSGCMQLKELSVPQTLKADGEVLPHSTVTPEYPISGLTLRVRGGDPERPDPATAKKLFPELVEYERIEYGYLTEVRPGSVSIAQNKYGFLGYEGTDEIYVTYSAAYLTEGGNIPVPEGYIDPLADDLRLTKRPIYAWTFPEGASAAMIHSYNTSLEAVRDTLLYLYINEWHEEFVSVDGVVFTKDKKTLVAFPSGRTGYYTVPDGTEHIGEKAFYRTSLDGIILPSSVTDIHENAFCDRWTPMDTAITLSFAVEKDAAAALMENVMGSLSYICREVKRITPQDITIEPIDNTALGNRTPEFLLTVGTYSKTVKSNYGYTEIPTVCVEDLTGDGYPEIVLIFAYEQGPSSLHRSYTRVLDGVTLEEYENPNRSVQEYVTFSADENAYYIECANGKHTIEKSRFNTDKTLFDSVVIGNTEYDSIQNGKLHRSLPCQFGEALFYGSIEIDYAFADGQFVCESCEFVTDSVRSIQTTVLTDMFSTTTWQTTVS